MHRLLLLTVAGMLASSPPQSLRDLLKGLGNEVSKAIDDTVEKEQDACASQAAQAAVKTVDPNKLSVVVRTSDGAAYQVKAIGWTTDEDVRPLVALATRIDFTLRTTKDTGKTYRVHFTYDPAPEGTPLGGLLQEQAQRRLKNDFDLELRAMTGETLNGKPWCFPIARQTLKSIEWLTPAKEHP